MINTRDAEPWCFGEEVEDVARNFISLRYRLMPYVYSTFYEAAQNGMPVNRSLALLHPHEANVYQEPYQNQYMFGRALLVVPVRSDQTCHKMWLPSGGWYNLYDDEHLAGNQNLILEYGKEKIPVFVKAGSVLCMQQKRNNLSEKFENETLELHLYQSSSFWLLIQTLIVSCIGEQNNLLISYFKILIGAEISEVWVQLTLC